MSEKNNHLTKDFVWEENSWISYLPDIYTKGLTKKSFLPRFLKIFESIYSEMGERIEEISGMLYPSVQDLECLRWLASWFDMENKNAWNIEQLSYLLENRSRLYSIRGTKSYLKEIVQLFTGCTPYIIEYYQLQPYKTDIRSTRLLEELYGENAYVVTLVLPQYKVSEQKELAVLRRLIRSCLPADMEYRLVILDTYIFLDGYSYVGLNSRLGGRKEAAIDGNAFTPYISAIGGSKEGREQL